MKPMDAVFMICIGVAIGGAAVYFSTPRPGGGSAPKPQVTIGEVTDLINRLRPFAADPDSEWRGISVRVTGASAKVEFRDKSDRDISAGGRSLPDAVAVLQDSARLKAALEGWPSR